MMVISMSLDILARRLALQAHYVLCALGAVDERKGIQSLNSVTREWMSKFCMCVLCCLPISGSVRLSVRTVERAELLYFGGLAP